MPHPPESPIPRRTPAPRALWRWAVPLLVCVLSAAMPLQTMAQTLGQTGARTVAQPPEQGLASELSPQQRAFLKNTVIHRARAEGWMPFNFINAQGEVSGITEDYWALIRAKLGIRETVTPALPFAEVLQRIERGEVDIYPGTTSTPDREAYALFSDGYESYPIAIATRRAANFIADAKALEGEIVAVGEDYSAYRLLKTRYPGIHFLQVRHTRAALEAVENGAAFAAVDILPVLQYQIEAFGSQQVRLAGVTDVQFALQMMVRREMAPLIPLLNHAIAAISPQERLAIHKKWMLRDVVKEPDYQLLWQAAAGALAIFAVILFWNRRLAAAHRQIARERATAQRYLDTVQTLMIALDREGRITMINPAGRELLGYDREEELIGRHWFTDCLPQPEGLERVFPMFQRLIKGSLEQLETFENRILCRDGGQRLVTWHNAFFRDDTGAIGGVICSGEDITDDREAELALQQALRQQRAAEHFANATIDALSAQLCVLDENGVVINVNQAWRDFADANPPAPPDYGIGARYPGIPHVADDDESSAAATAFAEQLQKVLGGEIDAFSHEYPRHSPRQQRWFVARVTRFRIAGKPRVVIAHEDITARRLAETSLQRFSRNFEAFLDQTSDFIYFKDDHSRLLFCSQPLANITGHANWREMIGKHDREVFPADTARIYEEEERPIFEQGVAILNRIDPYYDERGQHGYVMTSKWPLKDRAGKVCGIFGISRDITRMQNTQAALRASEEKLRGLFELSPLGIARNDMATRFLECNRAFRELTGYSERELHGLDYWRLSPNEDHEKAQQQLRHLIEQGYYGPFETKIRRKDGTRVLINLRGILLHGKDGEHSIWSIAENITARKQGERALIEARQAADAANQAKSAFLANMSHELRTPLNAILGFSQVLLQSPRLPAELTPQVDKIRRGGDYLLTLINDILDLSKVEAGRIELFPEPLSLGHFLREVTDMIRFRAEQKGVVFEYLANNDLPTRIQADPKRLRQVLLNLLGNAVKFTDQGEVRLCVDYRDGHLAVAVEDTGPGIVEEHLEQIFEPFAQSGSQQQKQQGTGLGLSISRKIIELMGGELRAESEIGRGSRFRFRIPLAASFEAAASETLARASTTPRAITGYRRADANRGPLRLLLVDDLSDNRQILRDLLAPLGFDIAEAGSGDECLHQAPRFRPHLVLMDVLMPGRDGLATMEALHQSPGFENLPVILISAQAFREHRDEGLARGGAAYLGKPVNLAELLDALAANLPLAWQYAEEQPAASDDPAPATPHPAPWLDALQQAVILGSGKILRGLLAERERQGVALPRALHDWVDDYQYERILEWISRQQPQDPD